MNDMIRPEDAEGLGLPVCTIHRDGTIYHTQWHQELSELFTLRVYTGGLLLDEPTMNGKVIKRTRMLDLVLQPEVEKMVGLMEENEWTDTFPKHPLAQRLETQIQALHDELSQAQTVIGTLLDLALDAIGASEDHQTARMAIRAHYPSETLTDDEVEEKLVMLCSASRNPVERIGIEFELANKSADPRAVDTLVEALDQTLREHGFQIEPKNEGFTP